MTDITNDPTDTRPQLIIKLLAEALKAAGIEHDAAVLLVRSPAPEHPSGYVVLGGTSGSFVACMVMMTSTLQQMALSLPEVPAPGPVVN